MKRTIFKRLPVVVVATAFVVIFFAATPAKAQYGCSGYGGNYSYSSCPTPSSSSTTDDGQSTNQTEDTNKTDNDSSTNNTTYEDSIEVATTTGNRFGWLIRILIFIFALMALLWLLILLWRRRDDDDEDKNKPSKSQHIVG